MLMGYPPKAPFLRNGDDEESRVHAEAQAMGLGQRGGHRDDEMVRDQDHMRLD